MRFHLLDSVSTPGNPAKANDDAWMAGTKLAAVIDGATSLNDPIMPGTSDAAWLAHLAAVHFLAHQDADGVNAALRAVTADLETEFMRERSRPPVAMHETPCASLMLIASAGDDAIDARWFGDCTAIIRLPDGAISIIGDALEKRTAEAQEVTQLAAQAGVAPASTANREEFLPSLRASRNRYNQGDGAWVLTPDPHCAARAKRATFAVSHDSLILVTSDGFTALVTDYGAFDVAALMEAVVTQGLAALIDELRAIESDDPSGIQFARYKKSDDATAILLRVSQT
jgi:serine/threonine protein phosphatase PrpC